MLYLKRRLPAANIVANETAARRDLIALVFVIKKEYEMFSDKYERSSDYLKQKNIGRDTKQYTWEIKKEKKSLFK